MICDGYLSVLFCFLCTFVTFQISFTEFTAMAEELDGEEFVVDKILDKRVRNGKIEYYLSWKVNFDFIFSKQKVSVCSIIAANSFARYHVHSSYKHI